MPLKIGHVLPLTLQDFKGEIACIVYISGCNFRCFYCHNPELVDIEKIKQLKGIREEEFFSFLDKRKDKLTGVVITGGEPTIYSELYDFIKKIKEKNYKVKLDTNGTNPELLQKLIDENLLDYIAMDIKASFNNYGKIVGKQIEVEKIKKSVEIVKKSKDYEFRTTVVFEILDDFEEISKIKGKRFILQQLRKGKMLKKYHKKPVSFEKLEEIKPDIVFAHESRQSPPYFAARLKEKIGYTLVTDQHDFHHKIPGHSFLKKIFRELDYFFLRN